MAIAPRPAGQALRDPSPPTLLPPAGPRSQGPTGEGAQWDPGNSSVPPRPAGPPARPGHAPAAEPCAARSRLVPLSCSLTQCPLGTDAPPQTAHTGRAQESLSPGGTETRAHLTAPRHTHRLWGPPPGWGPGGPAVFSPLTNRPSSPGPPALALARGSGVQACLPPPRVGHLGAGTGVQGTVGGRARSWGSSHISAGLALGRAPPTRTGLSAAPGSRDARSIND